MYHNFVIKFERRVSVSNIQTPTNGMESTRIDAGCDCGWPAFYGWLEYGQTVEEVYSAIRNMFDLHVRSEERPPND